MVLRKNGSIANWSIGLSTLILLTGCGRMQHTPASPLPTEMSSLAVPSVSSPTTPALRTPTSLPPTATALSPVATPLPPSATPVSPTLATSEATPEVPSIPPQPTPENPIGGGTVESGPFTFTLLLYQDDTLSPTTDVGPWAYSDLPGVGWHASWVYHGPSLQGPISELWGTQPDVGPCVGRDKLQEGDHGGRAGGGIRLPDTSQVGDSVRLVMRVQTPHGSYGAALRFVLSEGSDGFEPTNLSVEALPSQ